MSKLNKTEIRRLVTFAFSEAEAASPGGVRSVTSDDYLARIISGLAVYLPTTERRNVRNAMLHWEKMYGREYPNGIDGEPAVVPGRVPTTGFTVGEYDMPETCPECKRMNGRHSITCGISGMASRVPAKPPVAKNGKRPQGWDSV
jgi:hypothetical protein